MLTAAIIASLVSAGIAAARGIGKAVQGRRDIKEAKKMEKELGESPKFETPQAVDDYTNRMNLLAKQEMPGYSQMKSDIQESTATGMGQVGQLAQGEDKMAGLLGLMQGQKQSLRTLGTMAMQHQYGAQKEAVQAGLQKAPWEEKEFEYNDWVPWQQGKNRAIDMRNMGSQQRSEGWDMVAGAGIQGANLMSMNSWYNNMYPKPGGEPQPGDTGPSPTAVAEGFNDPFRSGYVPPQGTYDKLPF